ncbi:shikimate kinase [Parasphingorhabdus sp. SCSIO 66989]|uniref:Shikimate kinase n=1 Tax=Alterisphingorhabdus coralli TaxID=3071408 RepID=A0AA97F6E3_9SPHN|nr:shikimate kinase [Parasphingorhabdus sp. SCSIO 66989]WOE74138.1 shikimate kinase [Parasphingorhabdus sp. SCSIO 66989]
MTGIDRPIVLVGLMGSGKSTIGRRLANSLKLRFVDADEEIEKAADRTISEIFDEYGEKQFRDGERRVIARLIGKDPIVLATGGGAFVNDDTRALIKRDALSIWLDADLETLVERVSRKDTRPLLRNKSPRDVLTKLAAERNPLYAEADLRVTSANGPHMATVERILEALAQWQS